MTNAFISYTGHAQPDAQLAQYFAQRLGQLHQVFIQTAITAGQSWPDVVDSQLKQADFVVLLLSSQSASSDMVIEEVRRAVRLKAAHGRPVILPVRLGSVEMPYDLAAKVNRIQHLKWAAAGDEVAIADRLVAILGGTEAPVDEPGDALAQKPALLSADGAQVGALATSTQPLPAFDASWLRSLDSSGGPVRLDSPFYVPRPHDDSCRQQRALASLARLYQAAGDGKVRAVYLDFQAFGHKELASLDSLLLAIANQLYDELSLNLAPSAAWSAERTASQNLTRYLQHQLIGGQTEVVLLLMDEVDRLFGFPTLRDDFFALVRYWHSQRAFNARLSWLNMVLAYSTEASMFIKNENQSPFNVGERFELDDFDGGQLQALNARHGTPLQSPAQLQQLVALVGGHPFLVRKALHDITSGQHSPQSLFATATHDDGPFGDHLRYHMLRLHENTDLRQPLRQVLQDGQCPDDLSFFRLRSAGLIRGSDRLHAQPRCGLYASYFGAHL